MHRIQYCCALWFVLMPISCFAKNITVCYEDNNYPPYILNKLKSEHTPQGLLVEIILSAAKNVGITIEFIRRPWLRCQQMVKNNQAQALFAMIKTPERTNDFSFPKTEQQSLVTAEYGLFIKKKGPFDNKPQLTALRDEKRFLDIAAYQKQKVFGLSAPNGYVVHRLLSQHQLVSEFDYRLGEGVLAVSNNRLDGYVVEKRIGLNAIARQKLTASVYWSDIIVLSDHWYIPFNNTYYQQNSAEVERFWQAISQVKTTVIQEYFK